MQELVIKVEDSKYALVLQLLQSLDYVKVVSPKTTRPKNLREPKYDFSDLVGRLQWKGDAVAEQRSLRDEW